VQLSTSSQHHDVSSNVFDDVEQPAFDANCSADGSERRCGIVALFVQAQSLQQQQ